MEMEGEEDRKGERIGIWDIFCKGMEGRRHR